MENLFRVKRVYQLLQVGGSREAEGSRRARSGHARRRIESRYNRLEILLIEIERQSEHDEPYNNRTDNAVPLVASDSAKHPVIVFHQRVRLVENFL